MLAPETPRAFLRAGHRHGAAAETVLARDGLDAPMRAIARQAGGRRHDLPAVLRAIEALLTRAQRAGAIRDAQGNLRLEVDSPNRCIYTQIHVAGGDDLRVHHIADDDAVGQPPL